MTFKCASYGYAGHYGHRGSIKRKCILCAFCHAGSFTAIHGDVCHCHVPCDGVLYHFGGFFYLCLCFYDDSWVQNPPGSIKILWGVCEGVIAAILLYVGGLSAVQSVSIAIGFPLLFVCLLIAAALLKSIRSEFPNP